MSHCLSECSSAAVWLFTCLENGLKFGRLEGGRGALQAVPSLPHHLSRALHTSSASAGEHSSRNCPSLLMSELYSGWDGSQQSLGQKGRGGEASRNDCAVPNCCSHGAQCEPGVWCPCSLHRRAVTLLLR